MARKSRLSALGLSAGLALLPLPSQAQETTATESVKAAVDLALRFCPAYAMQGSSAVNTFDPIAKYDLAPNDQRHELQGNQVVSVARPHHSRLFIDDTSIVFLYFEEETQLCEVELFNSLQSALFVNYIGSSLTRNGFSVVENIENDGVRSGTFRSDSANSPYEVTLSVNVNERTVKVAVQPK